MDNRHFNYALNYKMKQVFTSFFYSILCPILAWCVLVFFWLAWPIKPSSYSIQLDGPDKFSVYNSPSQPKGKGVTFTDIRTAEWVQSGEYESIRLFKNYWAVFNWKGNIDIKGRPVFGRIYKMEE